MNEKLDILQMLHDGIISADEASKLLEAVSDAVPAGAVSVGAVSVGAVSAHVDPAQAALDEDVTFASENLERPAAPPDMGRFRRLGYIPFALSFALLFFAGSGAYAVFLRTEGRLTFGLVLLIALCVLALLLTALALWATTVPWLHVRIRSSPKERSSETRFAISLPLPLTVAGWAMRFARRFVDGEAADHLTAVTSLVQAMRHDLGKPGTEPIAIDINDENDRVQVYIG
jgi:hypothetical protein